MKVPDDCQQGVPGSLAGSGAQALFDAIDWPPCGPSGLYEVQLEQRAGLSPDKFRVGLLPSPTSELLGNPRAWKAKASHVAM